MTEDQVLTQPRTKDEFLALLGHELRNPLGAIRNSADIIQNTERCNTSIAGANKMIERQMIHLARLVDDLLDFARLSSGKLSLRRRKIDVVRSVRLAVDDYRDAFSAGQVALQESLPENAVWIEADPVRVTQIVCNLLNNALKFTDAGGTVRVRLIVEPGEVARISVKDSGVGVSPDSLSKVFEPLAQSEQGQHRGGLGVGLALVKGLAELHGGSVQAFSEGVGHGSEISVLLPVDKNQAAPDASVDTAVTRARKILVIEDNLDAAESINILLTLQGYSVKMAHTGAEGMAEAERFVPDVILCDIGLPGAMNGYAIAEAIRKSAALSKTSLIAVTGYGQEYDLERAKRAGFDVHLVKPFNPNELVRLLSNMQGVEGCSA